MRENGENPQSLPVSFDALSELYVPYNEEVKPLLALLEAEREEFPLSLFNEVRAMNDHVARCFLSGDVDRAKELEKAGRHVVRMKLDCFKCLNITFREKNDQFRKDMRHVDLTKISNGKFYSAYENKISESRKLVESAKVFEHKGETEKALELYEEAFVLNEEAYKLTQDIDIAHVKLIYFWWPATWKALLWLASNIAVGLITKYFF